LQKKLNASWTDKVKKNISTNKKKIILLVYPYLNLTEVELEFLTLKNITITTARLTGTRSNDGIETTGIELIVQKRINSRGSSTSGNLLLDTLGLLLSSFGLMI
jgi:hypothetical protein